VQASCEPPPGVARILREAVGPLNRIHIQRANRPRAPVYLALSDCVRATRELGCARRRMQPLHTSALGTTLIALSLLCSANAQKPHQIAEKAFPSVVLLVMQDAQGQTLALGSGFFVREDVVASNAHVIEGASKGFAKLVGQKTQYEISGVVRIDYEHDLVLLALKNAQAPPLPLGDSSHVEIGDEVYVVGNPLGLEGTFSSGIVSALRDIGSNRILQITAPISPGSSGGPVLDAEGKVIGVATATFTAGQNLNLAVPISYLPMQTLESPKVRSLADCTKPKTAKSMISGLGRNSTEGVVVRALECDWRQRIGGYLVDFSLKNQLSEPVKNVRYIVTFYDKGGEPVDYLPGMVSDTIPPGLAKRTSFWAPDNLPEASRRNDRLKIRVLDFQISD